MIRDINYESFDGKVYVTLRIRKTSPLHKIPTEDFPLFAEGEVKVIASNTRKNSHLLIGMKEDFYKKLILSEDSKPLNKTSSWYLSFICSDRFEADKVIDQIYELEGMDSEERLHLFSNSGFLYNPRLKQEGDLPYLRNISEITVSLEMDPDQTSKMALKLICRDKKKRTLNRIFSLNNQYSGFGIKISGADKSEVVVSIKNNKFYWTKIKYVNKYENTIERGKYDQ